MKTRLRRISLLLPALFFGSLAAQTGPNEQIRMIHPGDTAKNWESQVFHLGNGYFGASCYGGATREVFTLAEKTFWLGGPGDAAANDFGIIPYADKSALTKIRAFTAEGNIPEADKLAGIFNSNWNASFSCIGRLTLDFDGTAAGVTNYERTLDLSRSVCTIRYRLNEVNYTREYFCSYPGRVLAIRITADRPGAVNCTVGMDLYHRERNPETIVSKEAGTLDVLGHIDDNNRPYVLRIRLINEGGELVDSGNKLAARGCNAVTLYYTVATDYVLNAPLYRGADPAAITSDCIGRAVKTGYPRLREIHTADYRALYSRTRLSLGNSGEKAEILPTDERLNRFIKNSDYSDLGLKELAFNFGKYILISCSRPGALPAGLYGVWNDRYRARWNGVYQLDMNTTQTYMFGNALNLSECQVPFIEWTKDKAISGEALARAYFGSSGWFSGMIGDIWGTAGMLGDNGYKFNSTGWLALIAWEQYAFDRNRKYLQEIYPLLKGASQFYLDNLVEYKNTGKLVTFAFPSAEHVSPAGALMPNFQDIGFAAETFENTADAAAILGIDDGFRNSILQAKSRLMPYKTGSWGQFQEWVEDLDDPLCQHRHISHVLPLTPCHQINLLKNPEFAGPLKVTMNARGDAGFLALRHPEKGNSDLFPTKCTHEGYHFDNFTAQVWCRAARICDWLRLYDGSRADKIYNDILRESTLENMMQYETMLHYSVADSAATPCFPDGTVLSAGYVTEMVLQSHLGELHLLPALPPAWVTGSLTGIRARGGYTLDVHWKDGKLVKAVITADQTGTCRIRYGGKTRVLDLRGGKPLTVTEI